MTPRQLANTPAGNKLCVGPCGKELPKNGDHFDRDSSKEDGFKGWCKICRKERRQLVELKQTAELLKTLDCAVLTNLADARPGGSAIPHAVEIYENIMTLMGGVQGFAMHYVANLIAAKPGSQTRERQLTNLIKLGEAVSDDAKVSKPTDLMEDHELEAMVKKRDARMKTVDAQVTEVEAREVSDEESNELDA